MAGWAAAGSRRGGRSLKGGGGEWVLADEEVVLLGVEGVGGSVEALDVLVLDEADELLERGVEGGFARGESGDGYLLALLNSQKELAAALPMLSMRSRSSWYQPSSLVERTLVTLGPRVRCAPGSRSGWGYLRSSCR